MLGSGVGFALVACIAASAAGPEARQIGYLWSIDEFKTKADAVVIAEYRKTTEVGRGVEHPELKPALPVVEMESVFIALTFLKGNPGGEGNAGKEIRLKHYRVDWEEFRRRHPPLAGQPPAGVVNTGSALAFKASEVYLLFLKDGEGGRYLPLSGFTFPTDSVFLLQNEKSVYEQGERKDL